jgi:hypothetical protein
MNRRILIIDPSAERWWLEALHVETLEKDPREDYLVLSGETLCQCLLRRAPNALVIARGPMPFLSGNKASVGYVSPLTGVPHYSFVGGRAAAQLLNLGLDAICFQGVRNRVSSLHLRETLVSGAYIVATGHAPNLTVAFKPAGELPTGQRSAFYWLLEQELGGNTHAGSIGQPTWPSRRYITPGAAAPGPCSPASVPPWCYAENRLSCPSSSTTSLLLHWGKAVEGGPSPTTRMRLSDRSWTNIAPAYPPRAAAQSSNCFPPVLTRRARIPSHRGMPSTLATNWPIWEAQKC